MDGQPLRPGRVPRLSRARFRRLVREAVEGLPEQLRAALHNVDVQVRWRPSPQELRQAGLRRGDVLFGLYTGVPRPQRGSHYTWALPDRIIIYQEPHELACETLEEMVEQARRTLLHEIGHYLGLDEERLRELALD
jgi:predicted Zn-dependent protease with MMP-like domain